MSLFDHPLVRRMREQQEEFNGVFEMPSDEECEAAVDEIVREGNGRLMSVEVYEQTEAMIDQAMKEVFGRPFLLSIKGGKD